MKTIHITLLFCFVIILHTPLTFASKASAPDFTISEKIINQKLEITAIAPTGHHFNTDAPMSLALSHSKNSTQKNIFAPVTKTKSSVNFQIAASPAIINVSLYLCDDALTFCEKHEVTKNWTGTNFAPLQEQTAHKQPSAPKMLTSAEPTNIHSSLFLNDPVQAFALAQKQKKPLMIDFFGIWCPPCNMFDEEVFSTQSFQDMASDFILLRLDADDPSSWAIKSKYKVGGYPTILFTTHEGDEIFRVVGFRDENIFIQKMKLALKLKTESFKDLKKSAITLNDPQKRKRLGQIYLEREEFDQALKYLSGKDRLLAEIAQMEALQRKNASEDPKLYLKLHEFVLNYPNSPESLRMRLNLSEDFAKQKNKAKKNEQLRFIVKTAQVFLKKPVLLEDSDYTLPDVLYYEALAHEALDEEATAKQTYQKMAALYAKRIKALKSKKINRGYNLEYAYSLRKAGQTLAAEKIYVALQRAYPMEFTFYYNHARMKFAMKRYSEAQTLALNALAHSYGDNRLRVSKLLAETHQKQGHVQEALEVVTNALHSVQASKDLEVRTHHYITDLEKLKSQLSK